LFSGLSTLQAERGDPATQSVNDFLIVYVLKLKLTDCQMCVGSTNQHRSGQGGINIAPVVSPR